MSQKIKRTPIVILVALIGLMMLAACGSSTPNKNSGASFDSEKGLHTAGWLPAKHKESAQATIDACKECHGEELDGGIAGVSCTSCHMGGVYSAHTATWTSPAASHKDYVLQNPGALSKCSNAACHGSNFLGVAANGSNSDCTSCHTEPYYNCTSCHDYPPATGKHVLHVTGQSKPCTDCHVVTSSTHKNGSVTLATGITYSFTTRSCQPGCHGQKTW